MKRIASLLIGITLWPLVNVVAGEWHTEGNLRCADCHLSHASGEEIGAYEGPYLILLKKNSINELCLSCHDGSDLAAPDVLTPVEMYAATSAGESAAGHHQLPGYDHAGGHNLGLIAPTPLQSAGSAMELSCISCHAAHGNANYRNLSEDPARVGSNLSVVDGIQVFTDQKPSRPPNSVSTIAAYQRDNVGYVSGLDEWCTSCHNQLENNAPASSPAHFAGHPFGVALNQFVSEYHADPQHWIGGSGEGFTLDGISRLPILSPSATSFIAARTPQTSDRVSCISCHRGHGGDRRKNLRWPAVEGGATAMAGCQQCHNK